MTWTTRPAVRENTPLIIGLAGPTKSGKTVSAHRLARGLAPDGTIVMLNAEGPRGHQYADRFKYLACDITAPFSPERYEDAIRTIGERDKPDVLIIDSASHMHDGPGGMLEEHDAIAKRMAKGDETKLDKLTWAAWVKPKADENRFIYTMLGLSCPVILCFRAKEKLRIVPGKPPIDLGWQPIASDRVAFETIFTVMLPPHSKGVPDLSLSDLREPFDALIPGDQPIDEELGRRLAAWARGGTTSAREGRSAPAPPGAAPDDEAPPDDEATLRATLMATIKAEADKRKLSPGRRNKLWSDYIGAGRPETADPVALQDLLDAIRKMKGA